VIVHTKELLQQWVERIETFLRNPRSEIGVIGAGKMTIGEKITVGIVNSIYQVAGEIREHVGFLIVDECHRTPSRTFTEAVSAFDCRYMLGLSATPYRRDGLSRLIFWHIGDVRHEIKAEDLEETGDILKVKAVQRFTNFRSWADPATEYSKMLSALTQDSERNELIAGDVIREAGNGGGICLVLTDRRDHAVRLVTKIRSGGIRAEVLTGELPAKERQGIVERLNSGAIKVLVATGQLIGEGFDCRELSTLFLATPIRFDGRVKQYLGRVMRPAPGKDRAVVYDYVDERVGVLAASHRARQRVYEQNRNCGYNLGTP
jgi:superfamily II DNA or RNA helicase